MPATQHRSQSTRRPPTVHILDHRFIHSPLLSRPLQEGTTYNSYLVFGTEKTALVDASHEKFRGLYMKTLNAELAARGRQIDYIVVSHTEPDHSGAPASSALYRQGCLFHLA